MRIFLVKYVATVAGRLTAALIIAIFVFLGFGPEKWASAMLGAPPEFWLYVARIAFLVIAAIAAGVLAYAWFWRLKSTASKMSPPLEDTIPLHVAVMEGWNQLRTLPRFDEPQPCTEFKTRREYYESTPAKLPSIAAELIFNSASPCIAIEGVCPPRTAREWIPEEIAAGLAFSDNATELFDVFDSEKPVAERRRYIDLRVRQGDIQRRIKQMEESVK